MSSLCQNPELYVLFYPVIISVISVSFYCNKYAYWLGVYPDSNRNGDRQRHIP